jgi:translation initiation factor eIF-2B subunit epsilon
VAPKVSIITAKQLQSVGDALRDIDSKQILQGDFVLLTGDIISNMNLNQAVEAHKYSNSI